MDKNDKQKTSPKRGCLIILLIGSVLTFLILWQIGEPNRRAVRIHKAIHAGMDFRAVETLLTGRHYLTYQIMADQGWKQIPREEFVKLFELGGERPVPALRLWLTFLGMSPGRVSFFVEFDNSGHVSKITKPYGWD